VRKKIGSPFFCVNKQFRNSRTLKEPFNIFSLDFSDLRKIDPSPFCNDVYCNTRISRAHLKPIFQVPSSIFISFPWPFRTIPDDDQILSPFSFDVQKHVLRSLLRRVYLLSASLSLVHIKLQTITQPQNGS
jgi:hypothetical protein